MTRAKSLAKLTDSPLRHGVGGFYLLQQMYQGLLKRTDVSPGTWVLFGQMLGGAQLPHQLI